MDHRSCSMAPSLPFGQECSSSTPCRSKPSCDTGSTTRSSRATRSKHFPASNLADQITDKARSFASEIVEEENAIAGAKAAAQNASESSDDESSGEDDLEAGNLSAATLVDSPAPAATAAVAKQVKRAKPQSNRNAGPMAKKAGVTKA